MPPLIFLFIIASEWKYRNQGFILPKWKMCLRQDTTLFWCKTSKRSLWFILRNKNVVVDFKFCLTMFIIRRYKIVKSQLYFSRFINNDVEHSSRINHFDNTYRCKDLLHVSSKSTTPTTTISHFSYKKKSYWVFLCISADVYNTKSHVRF